ncbi:DNA mismatch repair protein MutS2 [Anseongella ginsenosidimutans]|uniref:Endonuclease MutS2 n=1 Tax=Anseongella ginsenosidimutans TaxID=496056 RepID=A0A4R3KUM2_9SPHI|nr:endonuclease MutS2 [Anseongella ginsenosidimutans]TCS88365.1 DNA mismatch repair protein MutS2 [Anseongella ginsenosidimutans]
MLYPVNIGDKLGFTEVKRLLRSYCLSPMGGERVDKMQFIARADLLGKLLRQTWEFRQILQDDAPFPASDYLDIRPLLHKIKPENAFLSEEEVFHLMLVLKTVFQAIRYMNEREGRYPALEQLFEKAQIEKEILSLISRVIDEKGEIRPDASQALSGIFQQIHKSELESRKRLDSIFRQAIKEGWIADGNLTIRQGRMVIPVQAEFKRKIKGYIHDESATGQTVFIEPAEVFDLNNRVRDLEFEKRREITRILIELTGQLKPFTFQLESYQQLLTNVDFIRAKALLAIRLQAELPKLSDEPVMRLVNARHPLLWLSHKESGQDVEPLTLTIEEEERILVLSGPNAGGKSVCLKTVGLLQLMLQSGMLVPASEFSEMGIFHKILADIGDDQSIESDLSTYSAHLSKMKEFISQAGERTLVLIDEFGTGTDPQFGGPLAEAVLEELNARKVRGVITTHYSNLKLFAGNTPGLVNASMLFDSKGLNPLYRLEMGKPGSSYAFEIAEKIGLPGKVLKTAREKAGAGQNYLDKLLIELEREKKELLDQGRELQRQQQRLDQLVSENTALKQHFEENRKKLLKEAKEEARGIISGANKLVENTISEIRQSGADKEQTREARRKLKETGGALTKKEEEKPVAAAKSAIVPGNWVKLPGSEAKGEVISVSRGNAVIAIGNLRTVAKLGQLEKVAGSKPGNAGSRASYTVYQQSENMKFNHEADLRGMRGEEALAELEKLMDRALMLGVGKLKVIHGKGDGILRKLIRNYLSEYPQVAKLEDEHPDRGGDGITYVHFS